ncbi:Elongation factor 1-gamma [Sigmodon hispidus]
MDASEQALAEPKAKDPFTHLPKSTFLLDQFKQKYSNEDTLSLALPYFGDHFDKNGWSLWYAEYHFPEELTQTFMSCCNLIIGMLQRLDKLRKNAFANIILFGINNSSSISVFLGLQRPRDCLPADSRLAGGLQVIYMTETGSWKRGNPDPASRVLFLGGNLPACGQSRQSWQDLQVNLSYHCQAACTYPSRKMGVIKGNNIGGKKKKEYVLRIVKCGNLLESIYWRFHVR